MTRRPLLTGGVSGLLVFGLVVGVSAVGDGGGDGGDAPVARPRPATSTTIRLPATSTTAPGPATQAAVDEAVDELLAFVSDVRGLEPLTPVTVELQEESEFLAGVLEDLDPDGELPGVSLTLQALKLAEPGTDLLAELTDALGDGVLGYYDPEKDALFVRGTSLTPFLKMTLVHELTHALQDQHFGLDVLEDLDGEAASGFQALAEGDAVSVQNEYLLELPRPEQVQLAREAAGFLATGEAGDDELAVLEELLLFPYTAGPAFIGAVMERGQGGTYGEVDAAFANPPVSSEQILHPEKYFGSEESLATEPPQARGEVVDSGNIGEFLLRLLLEDAMSEEDAREAAAGWGGDAYATWREGDTVVFSAHFTLDSPKDRDELVEALGSWARAHGSAQVTQMGDVVVLEASF